MFCKNCGALIADDSKNCPNCGQEITAAPKNEPDKSTEDETKSFFKGNYKSREGKILTGVCAGMGKRYGKNPWIFRAVFLIGSCIPLLGWFLLGYYIAAAITWKYDQNN